MQRNFLKYLCFALVITIFGCARRGSLTGGFKDTLAPVLKTSLPKNFTTNFKGNEIKLYFNEYIKLKNVNKQLIISPPMKNAPDVLPYNASKFITIKIKDTLRPNTTYSFNFGQSIEDYNEQNPYQQFKYVFSTGDFIDSLKLAASVEDAIEKKSKNFVSVMLYEVDENYNDSIIYKQVPQYVTNTLDSLKTVQFENLKEGKYKLVAIKDVNNNNKYDPKTDRIGFKKEFITLPNDSTYDLKIFKEELDFKAISLNQSAGNKLLLGYEGNPKDVKVEVKKGSEKIPVLLTKYPKKDSLQVWYPSVKDDSLSIEISRNNYKKTFALKVKDQKKDTVSFTSNQSTLHFRDKFKITSATPITAVDVSKIKLFSKDSVETKFTTEYDEYNQELKLNFEKQPSEKYKLSVLPKALTDYNGKTNDSIDFKFSTKSIEDYGNLKVVLENVKRFPIIVELTDKDGKILASEYSEKETIINFDLVEPYPFTLRLIYDDNKDKTWTPGNFLEQRQSEEVIYYPKEVDVRANWDVEQPFDVGR
jgi:uncharacterized protein (DUF2141 family)